MKTKIIHRLIEFFLVGLLMGIAEDLIAIHFATDAVITPHVFLVAAIVALPFAFISEIIVDLKFFKRIFDLRKSKPV